VVDPDGRVEETLENNNEAGKSIDIKTYADITPVGLEFLVNDVAVTTTPDTTEVTLRATVQNIGETDAQNVKVQFFNGDPSAGGVQIGSTQTIAVITALFGSGQAETVWTATVTGISEEHDIYVRVTGVNENILDNNVFTRNITVTLRPILTVIDIDFSDNSPFEGESFKIFAIVKNIGGTATSTFNIAISHTDPNDSGNQIGTESLSLGIDETGEINVSWIPSAGGAYEVYVVVDSDDTVDEADETNNMASEVIVVYTDNDIIVNNANTPENIGNPGLPEPIAPQHRGYVLVEEDGVLTITYTIFQVLESSDYQFNIIVRNNGTMIIEEGSILLTNGPLMRIYLYDNATLVIKDSTITSSIIDIMAYGNSKISIDESTINSFINANSPTANVMLDVTNSSLTQAFAYFGGTSDATFTNVITPSVELSAGASLTVYQWLMAYVKDGAGTGIEGSEVNVSHLFTSIEIPNSGKITDAEGLALFEIMTDIMTATTETSWLSYFVEAFYDYGTDTFGGNTSVTFTSYVDDKDNNIEDVEIFLDELRPDLVVDTTSIQFFKDGVERTTVGVNEEITITATVTNIGTAGTTESTQVLVKFYHDEKFLGENVITTPMVADGGTGIASITWIPHEDERGQNEEIEIFVDPNNDIPELNDSLDNNAFTTVNIIRPPDLDVTNIQFNTDEFTDITNTTESVLVYILATVTNVGLDNPAVGVNVSIYDGFPDFDGDMKPDAILPSGVELIGITSIASLPPGTSNTLSFEWDTTGKDKGHKIYVYVTDTIGGDYIPDQILTNNNETVNFVVLPKPDLKPEFLPPQTEYITLVNDDGTPITGTPQIGQGVNLQAIIFNYGQVYIHGVDVSFWNGNPQSGGTQIGNNVTISIAPNSPMNASVPWNIVGPGGVEGDVVIYVWVNPSEDIIESDYSNNVEGTTFSVVFADVNFFFTFIPKSSYAVDGTITVTARLEFSDTKEGIPNLPYTLRIRRADNDQQYGTEVTGTLSPDGNILREIAAPTAGGRYYLELTTTYGGTLTSDPSATFEVKEEEQPFLPLWMILLIIIIAVLVVVLAGVALAKLGVGKLVECGECGAFIHEGEKKCPKCGAVFESDNAKCSECGSWIPVDSKSCPECGAVFAGLEKDKKDYIERMKGQYAKYVDQYRGEAREDLGSGMTDEEFSEWWKANPKYVGFEDWLAREEELKKGRTKPCPACNTTNPESAAICFKCGTVFKKKEEAPPVMERPPQRPPAEVPAKRVSRPPEQRREQPPTVVPKKVVKQPPEVVPKKVVKRPPTVVPKKVVKRPPPEE
jgi:subtilase family serine protease